MSIRAARPCLSLVFTAAALTALLAVPVAAQQESKAQTFKVPFGKKFQIELPVPFELDCGHHVSAWSDDTNIFDVKLSGGFTKNPKVTVIPKSPGIAALNFDLVGKDQYEGESGDCTGSFMGTVSVRVLPDDKDLDKLAKDALKLVLKNLKQGYKSEWKLFVQTANELVNDFKQGAISLDPALDSLNSAYFDATISNLLNTRVSLTDVADQLGSNLAAFGAEPGFVGGHSQQGAWEVWDQSIYKVSTEHENAAQDLDGTMWKTWNSLSGLVDDPELVPEFTLVRPSYDYLKGFGVVPPNSGDWTQPAARLPATIYYLIGYSKECDTESGAMFAVGLAEPDFTLHGEVRIGSDLVEYDFPADSSGVWQAGFGTFGSYGHGGSDGGVSDPLSSGLARYDIFYEAESNPTNTLFITIP